MAYHLVKITRHGVHHVSSHATAAHAHHARMRHYTHEKGTHYGIMSSHGSFVGSTDKRLKASYHPSHRKHAAKPKSLMSLRLLR